MNVLNERKQTHGDWGKQSALSAKLKSLFFYSESWGRLTMSQQEALEMIAVKISRIISGNPNHPDHWEDIAGYATLALRELAPGKEETFPTATQVELMRQFPELAKDRVVFGPRPGDPPGTIASFDNPRAAEANS
jgi:hypothetical protein